MKKRVIFALLCMAVLVALIPGKVSAIHDYALRASDRIQIYSQWDADAYVDMTRTERIG